MTGAQRATAFLIAAVILIALADYVPHLVNGILALVLAGVVLNRSAEWQPLVANLGTALSGKK